MNKKSQPDVQRILLTHPILRDVEKDCIDEILVRSVVRLFAAGDVILREGEAGRSFWLLCAGGVRVFYTSEDGLEVTVKLFSAPAVFGELELLHPIPHMETCTALEDTVCLALPRVAFLDLLERFPRFAKGLLFDVSARFIIAAQHERVLAFLTVPQRLTKLLLSYVRLYGSPTEEGIMLRVPLSQTELANGLGVARKSVVRAFKDLTDAGIIERRGQSLLVRNLDALVEQAPSGVMGVDWRMGGRVSRDD